ncbi:MAG: hypothetical protein AAGG48_28550 [Planctomycetota bacterium]
MDTPRRRQHYGQINGSAATISDGLVRRNTDEASRDLPFFLAALPAARSGLLPRRLVVRMIPSYDDTHAELTKRVVVSLAALRIERGEATVR